MRSQLLWAWVVAFAWAAFTSQEYRAEAQETAWETEGEPTKEDVATLKLYSTAQSLLRRRRNRTRIFRTGSLSLLSRTATEDLSIFPTEMERNISHPESEAIFARDPCLGCCETPFPNHPGSKENQPSRGDSGTLGNSPTTAPPRRNGTQGNIRPGAFTPIMKNRKTESFSATLWTRPRETSPIPDRCQGCCRVNTTAGAISPGRREEGKGSPISEGSPSKGTWRPVLDRKAPSQQPSRSAEDKKWSLFSKDAAQNNAGR